MAFQDHFSTVGDAYRRHRPGYPEALFAFLGAVAPRGVLVWECGAGSGQATRGLAARFPRVLATDPSFEQLRRADVPGILRAVAVAERAPLPDRTAGLVVVAQALHWIEHAPFFREVTRVAAPGARLVVWTYGLPTIGGDLDGALRRFARETVGPFWPEARRHVEEAYASIDFPFEELPAPALDMRAEWTGARFLGYVRTWSAVRRAREATGRDPVAALAEEWSTGWPPGEIRAVRWPLTVRAFAVA